MDTTELRTAIEHEWQRAGFPCAGTADPGDFAIGCMEEDGRRYAKERSEAEPIDGDRLLTALRLLPARTPCETLGEDDDGEDRKTEAWDLLKACGPEED